MSMTIDERLEKLAEKHEALCHSVELLAGIQKQTEERMANLSDRMVALTDTLNRLPTIVIAHEERLDELEDGRPS